MHHKTRNINPEYPGPDIIVEAAHIIKQGGVVIFPTRGLYGLAVDAFNRAAVNRLFSIKERPGYKPILVLIQSRQVLGKLVTLIPPAAEKIMASFWPGKLTIVFEANPIVPSQLIAGTDRVGVRRPGHSVALALVESVGGPITGTSANISGDVGCSRVDEIDSLVLEKVDLVLDAGDLEGGAGSTVIDVTIDPPKILREGIVTAKEIFSVLDIKSDFSSKIV